MPMRAEKGTSLIFGKQAGEMSDVPSRVPAAITDPSDPSRPPLRAVAEAGASAEPHCCYDSEGQLTAIIASDWSVTTLDYLCPCQLAGRDFLAGWGSFASAWLSGRTEERLAGGAGGGNERPCSPARGGRKFWQDALGPPSSSGLALSA